MTMGLHALYSGKAMLATHLKPSAQCSLAYRGAGQTEHTLIDRHTDRGVPGLCRNLQLSFAGAAACIHCSYI
jgi:hypothetical protein